MDISVKILTTLLIFMLVLSGIGLFFVDPCKSPGEQSLSAKVCFSGAMLCLIGTLVTVTWIIWSF